MEEVLKNYDYTVQISGMTHEGQGVARINGFTVFVDNVLIGEEVEIRIIKIKKSYAIGKLINIKKSSPERVEPVCNSFKRCGGCSLLHISYEEQLRIKTNLVEDSIKRIAKLSNVKIHNTIGMKKPVYYRNKSMYPVKLDEDLIKVGFYAKRTHDIVEEDFCKIQMELSNKIKAIVKDFLVKEKISIYDEESGNGLVRNVMTRVGLKTKEIMVVLILTKENLPKKEELVDTLVKNVPEMTSIVINVNKRKSNVVLGDKNICIYGEMKIKDYIGDVEFKISPLSFYQVNPIQTEVLYKKVLEYAGLIGNEIVFDLYCGIGTIALFLAQNAKRVYGVEIVEDAVADAKENAKLNKIDNVEFLVGEAENIIPNLYKNGIKADVVVVDPPRKGCDEILLQTLVRMAPKRIVYVSCNPSTLARDLKFLDDNSYKVLEIQPVDMFPHTPHVETVTLIERRA